MGVDSRDHPWIFIHGIFRPFFAIFWCSFPLSPPLEIFLPTPLLLRTSSYDGNSVRHRAEREVGKDSVDFGSIPLFNLTKRFYNLTFT